MGEVKSFFSRLFQILYVMAIISLVICLGMALTGNANQDEIIIGGISLVCVFFGIGALQFLVLGKIGFNVDTNT